MLRRQLATSSPRALPLQQPTTSSASVSFRPLLRCSAPLPSGTLRNPSSDAAKANIPSISCSNSQPPGNLRNRTISWSTVGGEEAGTKEGDALLTCSVLSKALEHKLPSSSHLHVCVKQLLEETERQLNTQLRLVKVVYSDDHSVVPGWEGQQLGDRGITVVAEPVNNLLETLAARMVADAQKREARLLRTRVKNTAAQVVICASGVGLYESPKIISRFPDGRVTEDALDVFAAAVNKDPNKLANTFNQLRNSLIHPFTLAGLDMEVEDLNYAMTDALQELCPDECFILKHYKLLKASFHEEGFRES